MRAVDTDVLVRIIVRDDARQTEVADHCIERGAWVPFLAIAEFAWVLRSVYGRGPQEVATAIEMLLDHQHLTIQDSDVVAAALHEIRKRPKLRISDCLMLEASRKAGHIPFCTFDRDLGRLSDVDVL